MGVDVNFAPSRLVVGAGSSVIWGIDFAGDIQHEVMDCDAPRQGNFRWLHLNLADNATRLWIEHETGWPAAVREAMLGSDSHQLALVDGAVTCCVLHDFQRELNVHHTDRVGVLRVAMTNDMIVTARLYPLGAFDIVRRRLDDRARIDGPARALDLLVNAIIENVGDLMRKLSAEVQKAEDAYLAGNAAPGSRQLLDIRRRLSLLHRLLDGMQRVFLRLEDDDDLDETLHPTVEKLTQRLQSLDEDALGVRAQLRELRDELELLANQRLNQNLYTLSVLTALLMPATLVSGVFGMNTGDLPFTNANGTYAAIAIGALASLLVFLWLHRKGFFR